MSSTVEIRANSEEEALVTPETTSLVVEPGNSGYLSETDATAPNNSSQSRNRIPLALCSQQTALSTPGASLSVDEPPIMISTDSDTEQISAALGPHINTDPIMSSESTRSVPELELHCRTRAEVHPLGSSSANVSTSVPCHDGLVCRHRFSHLF